MDIIWLLFKAFYFLFFIIGAFGIALFLVQFKPTGKFIRKAFNAEIDWN